MSSTPVESLMMKPTKKVCDRNGAQLCWGLARLQLCNLTSVPRCPPSNHQLIRFPYGNVKTVIGAQLCGEHSAQIGEIGEIGESGGIGESGELQDENRRSARIRVTRCAQWLANNALVLYRFSIDALGAQYHIRRCGQRAPLWWWLTPGRYGWSDF
jgi:hypothetical protein